MLISAAFDLVAFLIDCSNDLISLNSLAYDDSFSLDFDDGGRVFDVLRVVVGNFNAVFEHWMTFVQRSMKRPFYDRNDVKIAPFCRVIFTVSCPLIVSPA